MRWPALQHADTLAQGVAAAWPARLRSGKDFPGPGKIIACVQQLENMLLGCIPSLNLVVVAPVGLVRIIGLAIAEVVKFARELLALLNGHRVTGLVWPLHLQRVVHCARFNGWKEDRCLGSPLTRHRSPR